MCQNGRMLGKGSGRFPLIRTQLQHRQWGKNPYGFFPPARM